MAEEVRAGYKRTEVGVIPEEWEVCGIGELSTKVGSGLTPTGGERTYKREGRPFLRSQNVGWGDLLLSDVAFIDDAIHHGFADTEIRVGDVFLNITGASIGRSAVADSRIEGGNVNQHVCIIRADQRRLNPRFLNHYLLSSSGQRQIDSFQAGGNRQGLNFREVRSIQLALPSPLEQRAIAEAISNVDALLGALDRLIAKKLNLKQAAMQELLTGRVRLPGFGGEWEVRRLGDIAPFQRGFDLPNSEIKPGLYPVVYSNGILKHHARFQALGPGVVTGRSGTIGTVTFVESPYWPHNTALWVTNFNCNDPRFIFYLYTRLGFDQLATGSGVPTLNRNDVHSCEVAIPPVVEEQIAIATVLSDMDAELTALEQRRDKTRDLKKGMIQELLTGRVRLV